MIRIYGGLLDRIDMGDLGTTIHGDLGSGGQLSAEAANYEYTHRSVSSLSRLARISVLDDFRHGDAQPVFDNDDLTPGNQAIIHININGLADLAIQLQDRAGR